MKSKKLISKMINVEGKFIYNKINKSILVNTKDRLITLKIHNK